MRLEFSALLPTDAHLRYSLLSDLQTEKKNDLRMQSCAITIFCRRRHTPQGKKMDPIQTWSLSTVLFLARLFLVIKSTYHHISPWIAAAYYNVSIFFTCITAGLALYSSMATHTEEPHIGCVDGDIAGAGTQISLRSAPLSEGVAISVAIQNLLQALRPPQKLAILCRAFQ
jgi:hypothetical protein